MPSLKALEEFRSSFSKIGGEDMLRLEQSLPYDEQPLPEHEPSMPLPSEPASSPEPPADTVSREGEVPDSPEETGDDLLRFGDLGDLLGGNASDYAEPGSASDLTELLDAIPDDPFGGADEPPGAVENTGDEFGIPPELLDGLDEDPDENGENPPPDVPEEDFFGETEGPEGNEHFQPPSETASDDSELSFNLDEFPDFGESENPVEEEALDLGDPVPSGESLEVNEAFPAAGFSEEGPEESVPDEDLDPAVADNGTGEPLDFGESDDFPDAVPDLDADGFDMGGEPLEEATDTGEPGDPDGDPDGDPFDQFSLDGIEGAGPGSSRDTDLDASLEDASLKDTGSDKTDDFALPGLDDIFDKTRSRSADSGMDEILGEPEEIRLSDREVARLRETLASYPLNLRIVCEELISEEVVAPDLMANLIKLLTKGAPPKETAVLAGKILNRTISIPKGFEKKTGAELEEEQASFRYIIIHKFLPVLRTFMAAALVLVCLGYLAWNFVYLPMKAESLYERGYNLIPEGEYSRSRDLFREAFAVHRKEEWFYRYAERYRDERQYLFAEEKYDELLNYTASRNKRNIPDKKAVLDYAAMESDYLKNYAKAETLLRRYILDFSIRDREALLAKGDNSLAWGEIEKEHYEDAREAYATLLEYYGRADPILERMLKYFIRTDNLGETLALKAHFMASEKRIISPGTLAELGGYLLDKRTQEVRGVPNEYLERIEGIRDILLRAVREDPVLPESYYHLSRYYRYMENPRDEELTLERAVEAFDAAGEETSKRIGYRITALQRYGEMHIHRGEFFRGEEFLVKAAGIYEDGVSRRVIAPSSQYGRLYADLGDLEYFVKDGNARAALERYGQAEESGYAPPEILYRMGASHYQLSQWSEALDRFTAASFPLPFNQRILYALGNASYMRGNYFAAQGYYDRLLEILESAMSRFVMVAPSDDPEQREFAERLMVVQNNLGVTLEALALRTGDSGFRARALGLYAESERAWDVITRNPDSMVRLRPSPDITAPGVNPAYLNVQNSLYPIPGYEPLFFVRIDKDLPEPSLWESLAPPAFRLSEGVDTGR